MSTPLGMGLRRAVLIIFILAWSCAINGQVRNEKYLWQSHLPGM